MSAPVAVHLLAADEAMRRGHGSTFIAVCGEPVSESCPADCESDRPYCLECVAEAVRWNALAAQESP